MSQSMAAAWCERPKPSESSKATSEVTHVLCATEGRGGHPPSWRCEARSQLRPRSMLRGSPFSTDCASSAKTVGSVHEPPDLLYGHPPSWFCRLIMEVTSNIYLVGRTKPREIFKTPQPRARKVRPPASIWHLPSGRLPHRRPPTSRSLNQTTLL